MCGQVSQTDTCIHCVLRHFGSIEKCTNEREKIEQKKSNDRKTMFDAKQKAQVAFHAFYFLIKSKFWIRFSCITEPYFTIISRGFDLISRIMPRISRTSQIEKKTQNVWISRFSPHDAIEMQKHEKSSKFSESVVEKPCANRLCK